VSNPNTRARRLVLQAGVVSLMPAALLAQPRMPVVGFLNGASYRGSDFLVRAFLNGLAEGGYAEGRNVAIEYRSGDGHYDRLPGLAAELAALQVQVIMAAGTPTGLPAKAATSTIPIVFVTGSDPIQQGLVTSFSHPDGNLTGATTLAVEMGRKRLELLRAVLPHAARFGALVNPVRPNVQPLLQDLLAASRSLGIALVMANASAEPELEPAFDLLARAKVEGLVIGTDTFYNSQSQRLGELTVHYALPAVYQYREFVAAGGLVSYGGSITDAYRLAGTYVARILRGARPSELPVQQSLKAEMYINVGTARVLGLTIPEAVLVRADELIGGSR